MRSRVRWRAASLVCASACVVALVACRPTFHGVVLEPPGPAPPLALADSTGATFDLAAQRGKVVLVFFGYTHCPDVCPTTLADWRKAKALLGADARDVRWIFVGVDAERDTPLATHRYAARIDPAFTGLGGTPAAVQATLAQWKIGVFRDAGGSDAAYTVSHPSAVYVIDREGRHRLLQRSGLPPAEVAEDIRNLL